MRADSIAQAKSDIWTAIKQRSGISAFSAGSPVVSVGMTLDPNWMNPADCYRALILAESADAARIAEDAIGHTECEVVLMPKFAEARVTKEYVQDHRDPLEDGQQVRREQAGYVGTGSLFLRGGYQVTNLHVVRMNNPVGSIMRQGHSRYGVCAHAGEIDPQNAKFDVALIKVTPPEEGGRKARLRWSWALRDDVQGIRSVRDEEIGDPAVVTGQTDGSRKGILWGTGLDNLPVSYDGLTAWYDGLNVWRGPRGGAFSLPGYSGSAIKMPSDKHCTDLLFAGGPDAQGRDLTFSCDMPGAIKWAGGVPELAGG